MPSEEPAVVRTKRLVLRYFAPADAPAVHAYDSDPEVRRFLSPRPAPTMDLARMAAAHLAALRGAVPGASVALAVVRGEDLIGEVTLTRVLLREGYFLGFVLRRDTWGAGLATEAGRGVLRYAFETLRTPRIRAGCHPGNVASAKVLRKIGMTPRGTKACFPHAPLGIGTWAFDVERAVWLRWYGRA